MQNLKRLLILSVLLFLTSCAEEKNRVKIIFTLENSVVEVSEFKVCKTKYGFEFSLDNSFQQKVASQKIKTIFVANSDRKIEIKTFNILYSPPENFNHKTPTKPNGALAFFKNGDDLIIDILSSDKKELISLIGKEKVLNCASH